MEVTAALTTVYYQSKDVKGTRIICLHVTVINPIDKVSDILRPCVSYKHYAFYMDKVGPGLANTLFLFYSTSTAQLYK